MSLEVISGKVVRSLNGELCFNLTLNVDGELVNISESLGSDVLVSDTSNFLTIDEAIDRYGDSIKKDESVQNEKIRLRNIWSNRSNASYFRQVKAYFANEDITYWHEITKTHIYDFIAYKEKKGKLVKRRLNKIEFEEVRVGNLSNGTINKYISVFSRVNNVLKNVWDKKSFDFSLSIFKRRENSVERYLEAKEIQVMLQYSTPHMRDMIILALNTGLRQSDILYMEWSEVSFSLKTITVTAKGDKKVTIPMNKIVESVLRRRLNAGKHITKVFNEWKSRSSFKASWKDFIDRVGINIRFHDMRHTFASIAIQNGVELVTIKELLGHNSLNTTMRYAHLKDEQRRKASNKICKIFNNYMVNAMQ